MCLCTEHDNIVKWSPARNAVIVCCLLQGSYGIVKLAYNEEDDTHYVSTSLHSSPESNYTYIGSGMGRL
jgi:hypothetical protein